ncbi:MAG: hypothetical protein KC561_07240, partial [Myxococcales bacterium]|nr:hypothetical protein [Myxococcales bacterium]
MESEHSELAAIQQGDTQAFARWMAANEERIRLSLSRFASAVDVESVVQDTLLKVWHAAPHFVSDGKPE